MIPWWYWLWLCDKNSWPKSCSCVCCLPFQSFHPSEWDPDYGGVIMALAIWTACSSDFLYRELVFPAPVSRSFHHDWRDPNVPTCECLRFGLTCGNRRSSPSSLSCEVFFFLLDYDFCSSWRLSTLVAHFSMMIMSDIDSDLVCHGRECNFPLFHLVPPVFCKGLFMMCSVADNPEQIPSSCACDAWCTLTVLLF